MTVTVQASSDSSESTLDYLTPPKTFAFHRPRGGSPLSLTLKHAPERNVDHSPTRPASSVTTSVSTSRSSTSSSSSSTSTSSSSSLFLVFCATALILSGVVCFALFEIITSHYASAAHVITLSQYLTIIASNSHVPFKPRAIPFKFIAGLLVLTFSSGFLSNLAVGKVPVPLFLVVRNVNLPLTMAVGCLALRKTYSAMHQLAVGVVTVGVIAAVLITNTSSSTSSDSGITPTSTLIGCGLVFLAVTCYSCMSALQSHVFDTYGKATDECLFYVHLFALPCFLPMASTITTNAYGMATTWVDAGFVSVPLLALLGVNVISSSIFKLVMFKLLTATGPVTTTLLITLYRLFSVLVSVLFLSSSGSKPPMALWLAVGAVFAGSLGYAVAESWSKATKGTTANAVPVKTIKHKED